MNARQALRDILDLIEKQERNISGPSGGGDNGARRSVIFYTTEDYSLWREALAEAMAND